MVRSAFLVAVLAGLASASPVASDNRATPCNDIESCDFDQQCVQGTCQVGNPSQSGNAARDVTPQSALICTPEICLTATNYIYNSDLAVLGTYYSPYVGVGVGGAWIESWTIEGVAGVVVNPLLGAGGVGWRTNEVAVRAYWADGGFSYILEDLPVGRSVTVQFMVRDSQGTYVCTQPSVYVLYLEVDNYPKQTFRVTPHGGKKRQSFRFIATDSIMKIRFSAEKDAYDGCGPFFTNVQAIA
ncbi:hypothetical protein ISF_09172 [Cordyceps fumosorosea ARSEF 2679]|uniref:Uncharacterized protein n=1 Tax=Cordyceps fumosorosea (strain ARSEF 2679) TaxID=1081104 RepID=A0A167LBM5_CORFA|nr:hypothetical protein ISF_09172 [Cordyceps fumosorosea ARSEF 2679]OAA52894.1 hypothetical protein ISF_09172 [Cordyceps fumosorosea ARSEF 2679]